MSQEFISSEHAEEGARLCRARDKTMTTKELDKCLFCPSQSVKVWGPDARTGMLHVTCDNCFARGPSRGSRRDAVAGWLKNFPKGRAETPTRGESMTTPDPITTAREALERLWKARDLCHPDSMIMHYDSVMAAFDYAEKLKAEADPEALVIAHMHGAQMATEKHRAEITRLTSQLEQAERFAELISDGFEYQDYSDCADDEPMVIDATVGDMRRASQWIKDRQAKGEG